MQSKPNDPNYLTEEWTQKNLEWRWNGWNDEILPAYPFTEGWLFRRMTHASFTDTYRYDIFTIFSYKILNIFINNYANLLYISNQKIRNLYLEDHNRQSQRIFSKIIWCTLLYCETHAVANYKSASQAVRFCKDTVPDVYFAELRKWTRWNTIEKYNRIVWLKRSSIYSSAP